MTLKNLRSRFERFCFRNRNKGIPNLMLYVCLGTALVYLFSLTTGNSVLYQLLYFDRALILKGQVWRLFSYVFTYGYGSWNILLVAVGLICYYSLGRAMENIWGTCRFNLFYFTGILMMDIYCMIFDGMADVSYLNMSLFLGYATLYPNAQFLFLYIIPVKAWVFAVIDLAIVVINLFILPFPANLFPVIALANYFLFFGKDIINVFPLSWQANARRLFRVGKPQTRKSTVKPIPFNSAGSYQATTASVKAPYNHRCTVCGKTDVSNPELEFRYCSRCQGYYCYCEDHISNHAHIED